MKTSDETREELFPKLIEVLEEIDQAIVTSGRHPEYHREIMNEHRAQWPTLWNALDKARALLSYIKQENS